MFAEKELKNNKISKRHNFFNIEKKDLKKKNKNKVYATLTFFIFLFLLNLANLNYRSNESLNKNTINFAKKVSQDDVYFANNVLSKIKLWQSSPVSKDLISKALEESLQEPKAHYQLMKFSIIERIMLKHLIASETGSNQNDELTIDYIKSVFATMGTHIHQNSNKMAINPEIYKQKDKMSDEVLEIERNKSPLNNVFTNISGNNKISTYYEFIPKFLDIEAQDLYLNRYFSLSIFAQKLLEQKNPEEYINKIRAITKNDAVAKKEILNAFKKGLDNPQLLWDEHFKDKMGTEMPEWFLMLNKKKLKENINLEETDDYIKNTENMTKLLLFKNQSLDNNGNKKNSQMTSEDEEKILKQAKEILDKQISQMENPKKS